MAGHDGGAGEPGGNDFGVEAQEDAFAALFDGGQPVEVVGEGGTLDCDVQVLEVAVDRGGGGFEAGEAVEAGDLAQPVDRDDRGDGGEAGAVAVPLVAGERAGVEAGVGCVGADLRQAGGEEIEFGDLGGLGEVLVAGGAKLRDAGDDVGVAPPLQCSAQRRVGAAGEGHFRLGRDPVDRVHLPLDQAGQLVLGGRQRDDGQHLREIGVGRGAGEEAQVLATVGIVLVQPGAAPATFAEATIGLRVAQRQCRAAAAGDAGRGGVARGAAFFQPERLHAAAGLVDMDGVGPVDVL